MIFLTYNLIAVELCFISEAEHSVGFILIRVLSFDSLIASHQVRQV